jgi:transcriptional regulator with XRE-family HTH domain
MSFDLGERLKTVRQMYGLSQRELAKRAGVTNGLISLIEQNRTSPSVGSLKKVLDGLPISFSDFFAADIPLQPQVFFRAEDLVDLTEGDVSYRQVGTDLRGRALQMLHERYAPGADTGRTPLSHRAEECGIVVKGRIELTVGGKKKVLGPGDAYYFDSRLPHRFRNVGDEECELVSACSPPSF